MTIALGIPVSVDGNLAVRVADLSGDDLSLLEEALTDFQGIVTDLGGSLRWTVPDAATGTAEPAVAPAAPVRSVSARPASRVKTAEKINRRVEGFRHQVPGGLSAVILLLLSRNPHGATSKELAKSANNGGYTPFNSGGRNRMATLRSSTSPALAKMMKTGLVASNGRTPAVYSLTETGARGDVLSIAAQLAAQTGFSL